MSYPIIRATFYKFWLRRWRFWNLRVNAPKPTEISSRKCNGECVIWQAGAEFTSSAQCKCRRG